MCCELLFLKKNGEGASCLFNDVEWECCAPSSFGKKNQLGARSQRCVFTTGGGQNHQDGDAQSATWTEMLETEASGGL